MTREILVVERKIIFPTEAFQGFLPLYYKDYIKIILKNYQYKERNVGLENDSNYLQIIPYIWLINKKTKKAFIYKRAPSSGEYKENRHLNRYSGGIGGHIDKESKIYENPIMQAAMREMREEIIMNEYPKIKFIGYINDDSDIYNQVHFGIVGIAETEFDAKAGDGMAHGAFYSIEEIEKIFKNKENEIELWTNITWPSIRKIISLI